MTFRSCKSLSPVFHFIYDTHRIKHNTPTFYHFFETQSIANNSNFTEKQAFTISYLTKSCRLSLEFAISTSKKINTKSTEKPDSVLELLRLCAFTEKHIPRLISTYPNFILVDPERTLRPKIEYFESLTVFNVEKVMVPNIYYTLRAHSVPESHIGKIIILKPCALMLSVDVFKEVADAVKEMGFDPKTRSYLLVVSSMLAISKLNWEKKKEAYMSFGWSESDFNSAFKLELLCIISSKKKIRKVMDFFVNKAGLESRIIPRCSVLQVLMSKGLIGKDVDVVSVLNCNKKVFETRFLTKYKEVTPEVIKAYKGEVGFQGFNTGLYDNVESKMRVNGRYAGNSRELTIWCI
ncbi:uncharacterized protein LOC132271576 [Cornus florida]|uniref:uncharacterized protein LOC132271576 n=1 Tax=Cornus florida TaxID=4283 RepID=UPI00289FFF37|nr:uncharacterized protein LOC132271576 [Cornus florida]